MAELNNQTSRKNIKFLWRLFEVFFLLLVVYLPFQVAFNPSQQIDLASLRVLIIGLFLFWLVIFLADEWPVFPVGFQGFGLAAVLVISVLSLCFAQNAAWGWRKTLFFITIFPLYFVASGFLAGAPKSGKKTSVSKKLYRSDPELESKQYFYQSKVMTDGRLAPGCLFWQNIWQSDRHIKEFFCCLRIIKALIFSALIVSFLGLLQFLAQFFFGILTMTEFYVKKIGSIFWGQSFSSVVIEYPSWLVNVGGRTIFRLMALFPDPHMTAFFLGLILPLVFSLYLLAKKQSFWLLIINSLLFVALVLTFSRGGYLGILFGLAVVLVLSWRRLTQKKKALVLTVVVLTLFVAIFFAQPILYRFFSSFSFLDNSSLDRLAIWQNSFKVFLSHPLFGVGLGNYPLEADPLASYRNPTTSHNLYLDILAETGIFGLLAWLFLIFGSVWRLAASIRQKDSKKNFDFSIALKIGLIGSLVYFSVHSFFETPIFNPTILALLMIILAMANFSMRREFAFETEKISLGSF